MGSREFRGSFPIPGSLVPNWYWGGRVFFCPVEGVRGQSRRVINLTTLPCWAEFKNGWSYTYADPRLFMIRRFINSGHVELAVSEWRNIVMRSETVFEIWNSRSWFPVGIIRGSRSAVGLSVSLVYGNVISSRFWCVIGDVHLQCDDCPGNTDVRSKEIGLLHRPICL
jgi:hypothetical protein